MRDFTSTERVEVGGVAYEVGAIPHRLFRRFSLQAAEVIRRSQRRALLKLRAEGVESPTEEEIKAERFDADFLDQQERNRIDLVRLALRSIAGVPSNTEDFEYAGAIGPATWKATPLAAMAEIADDRETLSVLFSAVVEKNTVTEAARKNSPPPSPTAQGDGGATSA